MILAHDSNPDRRVKNVEYFISIIPTSIFGIFKDLEMHARYCSEAPFQITNAKEQAEELKTKVHKYITGLQSQVDQFDWATEDAKNSIGKEQELLEQKISHSSPFQVLHTDNLISKKLEDLKIHNAMKQKKPVLEEKGFFPPGMFINFSSGQNGPTCYKTKRKYMYM